jgi:hypothetical protein
MSERSQRRSSRIQLLLLVGMSVLSIGGAYLLFQAAEQGGALWGTTNKGTFVEPPLTVADLGVRDGSGALQTGDGTWWLWVVPQGPCEADCLHALHQLRQLHILLHRDANRVHRGLLVADPATVNPDLAQEYPQLAFLSGKVDALARGIYVIDPIGNLVLHYPLEDAGRPVLDDLKRLLRVSRIG